MDWSSLLKYLTSSKSLVIASFTTSLVLICGGGYLFPIEIAPKGYVRLALIGVATFSGVLLVIVIINLLWGITCKFFKKLIQAWSGRTLSSNEMSLILGMAPRANEPTNFSLCDYSQTEFTKLEILHIVEKLRKKGYIEEHLYDETIAYLTPKGRKKALELIEKQARSA